MLTMVALVLRRQRQVDLCKLEASLIYIPSSRTARIEPVSKEKKKRHTTQGGGSKTSLPKGPRAG